MLKSLLAVLHLLILGYTFKALYFNWRNFISQHLQGLLNCGRGLRQVTNYKIICFCLGVILQSNCLLTFFDVRTRLIEHLALWDQWVCFGKWHLVEFNKTLFELVSKWLRLAYICTKVIYADIGGVFWRKIWVFQCYVGFIVCFCCYWIILQFLAVEIDTVNLFLCINNW